MSDAKVATSAHGVVLVLLSALCIGAWATHLFALTALARLNQLHPGVIWWMQAVTGSLSTIFGAPRSSIGRSHPVCDNIFQTIECSTCYGAPPLPA